MRHCFNSICCSSHWYASSAFSFTLPRTSAISWPLLYTLGCFFSTQHWDTSLSVYYSFPHTLVYGDSPITIVGIFLCMGIIIPIPHHNIQIFLWPRKYNNVSYNIYVSYTVCVSWINICSNVRFTNSELWQWLYSFDKWSWLCVIQYSVLQLPPTHFTQGNLYKSLQPPRLTHWKASSTQSTTTSIILGPFFNSLLPQYLTHWDNYATLSYRPH